MFVDSDLGDDLVGAYVSHNHPIDETLFSFSDDDFTMFETHSLSTRLIDFHIFN